jgi:hypothetical protein
MKENRQPVPADRQDVQMYHDLSRPFTRNSFREKNRKLRFSTCVKEIVMNDVKKEVRNKWLHIRLNETEYQAINCQWQKTTSKELSDYARRVLLKKPVMVNHRNQSADEILAELIRLKSELHAIGNNFNQVVHKLHTLDTIPQIKIWLLANENLRNSFLKKTEEIKIRMNQIYEQWSQK